MYHYAIAGLHFASYHAFNKKNLPLSFFSLFDSFTYSLCITQLEYLLNSKGYEESYLLSRSLILRNILGWQNPLSHASLIISYFSDNFLDFENWLEVPIESFKAINSLFDNSSTWPSAEEIIKQPYGAIKQIYTNIEYNEYTTNYLLLGALHFADISWDTIFHYAAARYTKGIFLQNFAEQFKKENHDSLKKLLLKIITTIFFHQSASLAIKYYIQSVEDELKVISYKKSIKLMMDTENSMKIASHQEGRRLFDSFPKDVYLAHELSVAPIINFFRGYVEFIQALKKVSDSGIFYYPDSTYIVDFFIGQVKSGPNNLSIFTNSNNYILGIFALNNLKQFIYERISRDRIENTETNDEEWRKLNNILHHFSHKTKEIIRSDSNDFIYNTTIIHLTNIIAPLDKMAKFALYNSLLGKLIINLDDLLTVIFFLKKYSNQEIDLGGLNLMFNAHISVIKFLNGRLTAGETNLNLSIHLKKIQEFLDIIENLKGTSAKKTTYEGDSIIFENYKLFLYDKLLTYADELKIKLGEVNAVTGPSGCGKSTVIDDIKHRLHWPLASTGTIYMPTINGQKLKIFSFQKQLYTPTGKSLLEVILSPNMPENYTTKELETLKEFIIELLTQLKIDEFVGNQDNSKSLIHLLDKEDFSLSGGQQQKIAIIQAILRKTSLDAKTPCLIFLDETFTGLDPDSLKRVQEVIIKHLKQCTILIVDHEAPNHAEICDENKNCENFYNGHVCFDDQGIHHCSLDFSPPIIEDGE